MHRALTTPIAFPLQGRPGVTLPETGFGQIRFADVHVDPEDYFPAGIRQQLKFAPDPAQTQDFLRPPFKDQIWWSNNRIMPRPGGFGDYQLITVNLIVIAETADGAITCDIDVGSPAGPTGSSDYNLRKGAGVEERVSFLIGIQTLANFLANGAKIFLTGTVSFSVPSEAVLIAPFSTGPGL